MHGVFVEDESLSRLAALPFVREFRLTSYSWQQVDSAVLAQDIRNRADAERDRLRRVAAQVGVRQGFEVRQGRAVACVAGMCTTTDIVAIQGRGDADLGAMAGSPAASLFLPDRWAHPHGELVAVALSSDDPVFAVGARLARALGTGLVAILADGETGRVPEAAETRHAASTATADIARVLGRTDERLIVLGRTVADALGADGAARLARSRHAAVLAV